MKKVEDMTIEELEAAMAEKKQAADAQAKKEREAYEKKRNYIVEDLMLNANIISEALVNFNNTARLQMAYLKEQLEKYGKMRANSKGGFQVENEEGNMRILFQHKSISGYDERADKAEVLLKEFLGDTIKKKDQKMYEMIMSLLERNGAGQLEYSRVQGLYKFENDYADPRWKDAIKLFKESFNVKSSKMQIYFYQKDEKDEWQPVKMNFSGL